MAEQSTYDGRHPEPPYQTDQLECVDCDVDLAAVYPEFDEPLCYYCYMDRLYSDEKGPTDDE